MFKFENYCDDSGTDGDSPIAVAACYISSKEQWDEFTRNWNDVLRDEEFKYFHMAEFVAKPEAGHEPFCGWDNTKKARVYAKLASIINTRVRHGFAVAIPKETFDRSAPQHFLDNYAQDHYTYAVMCCIGLIADWRAQYRVIPPIQYVFDQGSPQKQIEAVWTLLENDPAPAEKYGLAPGGHGFQNMKLFKPLQAADILAWQMRNHTKRMLDKFKSLSLATPADDVNMCHPGFRVLRQNRPMRLGFFSEEQMRKVFTDLEEYEQNYGRPAYPSLLIPKLA